MRPNRRAIVVSLALAAASGLSVNRAEAQADPRSGDEPAPATVNPPQLRRFVEARRPEGVATDQPVSVQLEIVIDEQGHVQDATVTESAGEAFDQAALEAVRQFEFEPARRGETRITVRIAYRYVFEAPPAEADAAESPAPAVADAPGEPDQAPAPAAAPSEPEPAEPAGSAPPPPPDEQFGAVAEIEAPPREVTKRSVPQEQLTIIPGTGGDALRAIEVMPGVARTTVDEGQPILRGADDEESRTFIEGTPVPLLFHMGGVKSAFNSHLLKRVELYPGNFSARFGRATGGIVDARVRDPQMDRLHGMLELSLADSSLLLESPVNEDAGLAVAARRSNIDFFFENFVPNDAYSVVAAPVYWDYQAIGTYQLHPRHRLRMISWGSRDSIRLLFSDPSVFDPALRGNIAVSIEYHRLQTELHSQLSDHVNQRLQLTYGKSSGVQNFGPLNSNFRFHELYGRGEWSIEAARRLRINLGFDLDASFLKGKYIGPQAPQLEGDTSMSDGLSTWETQRVEGTLSIVRPAAYAELEIRPIDRLLLVPGLRLDYYGYIEEYTVDPRLAVRYEVSDWTAFKWGVGIFSQPPEYFQGIPGFGNPDIEPYHALHTSVGVEQHLTDAFEVGLEGFYKRLTHRVVATPGGQPPAIENNGVGRIYGGELSAKLQTASTFGYLAYTLSRSERRDRSDPWRLFENDQTHILSLVASHKLGRGWELGGRFRLVSGNPETPVLGGVYDAGIGQYRALNGPAFSARSPVFHQLDLRIEKQWQWTDWSLAAYLDLQNAYNAKNVEGTSYSYDYSQSESAYGLPIFPNLGIRGEL